ncbi:MAG: desulfoferrodoxin [Deltaproteobacteria bacterium]|nr:desulfoferrodoxin [Deltaproteobacteria bacterium]
MEVKVYRCEACGNIVEVLNEGPGALVCCGKEMVLISENTTEAAVEKHIPVVEKIEGGIKVTVGSVEHPMTEKHYIQWIELISENRVSRVHLSHEDKPVAEFMLNDNEKFYVRAYCNLHGLWKGE